MAEDPISSQRPPVGGVSCDSCENLSFWEWASNYSICQLTVRSIQSSAPQIRIVPLFEGSDRAPNGPPLLTPRLQIPIPLHPPLRSAFTSTSGSPSPSLPLRILLPVRLYFHLHFNFQFQFHFNFNFKSAFTSTSISNSTSGPPLLTP
jgi:hypothetical protein